MKKLILLILILAGWCCGFQSYSLTLEQSKKKIVKTDRFNHRPGAFFGAPEYVSGEFFIGTVVDTAFFSKLDATLSKLFELEPSTESFRVISLSNDNYNNFYKDSIKINPDPCLVSYQDRMVPFYFKNSYLVLFNGSYYIMPANTPEEYMRKTSKKKHLKLKYYLLETPSEYFFIYKDGAFDYLDYSDPRYHQIYKEGATIDQYSVEGSPRK